MHTHFILFCNYIKLGILKIILLGYRTEHYFIRIVQNKNKIFLAIV